MESIIKLEIELHQFSTRSNQRRLEQLIHEEFTEIGYSGRVYTKADIVSELTAEQEPNFSVWSQDFDVITLAKDLIQLRYKEARMDSEGHLSRHAIRTSIWQQQQGWQVRFHQATPTTEFTKRVSSI